MTFYFSERHYLYWKNVSKRIPFFIILQDPASGTIYWQHFSELTIEETTKHWKIDIPIGNVLDETTKQKIELILHRNVDKTSAYAKQYTLEHQKTSLKGQLRIRYFLKHKKLNIEIVDANTPIIIDLGYKVRPELWDTQKSKLSWEDPYYFSLSSLEEFILNKYEQSHNEGPNIMYLICQEIQQMVAEGGIEKVAETMFNHTNGQHNIPSYKQFLSAFEQHTKLKREEYAVKAVGYILIFITEDESFIVDTYQGKTAELRYFINKRSYDEIYTQTNAWI